MKTAVIYARYSSERQTEQSIEGQVRVCTEYAQRNDIFILDTYIDRAMTGTNDNRTDFQRMLKDSAKRAWDYVLVYQLIKNSSEEKKEKEFRLKTAKANHEKFEECRKTLQRLFYDLKLSFNIAESLEDTLYSYKPYWKELTKNDVTRLQKIKSPVFQEVISYMLEQNCKLEQEAETIDCGDKYKAY